MFGEYLDKELRRDFGDEADVGWFYDANGAFEGASPLLEGLLPEILQGGAIDGGLLPRDVPEIISLTPTQRCYKVYTLYLQDGKDGVYQHKGYRVFEVAVEEDQEGDGYDDPPGLDDSDLEIPDLGPLN